MRLNSCIAVLGALLLAHVPLAARADWIEAKSRHFTVYSDGSAKQLTEFAEDLERFDFLLRLMTGIDRNAGQDSSAPVRIWLLLNDQAVHEAMDSQSVSGVYFPTARGGVAIASRERATSQFDASGKTTLLHEYAHHFMLHYFPAGYPAWYVEGFAEFFSTARATEQGKMELGRPQMERVPGLLSASLFPLASLTSRASTSGMTLEQGDRFYGTAWLLTHFLEFRPERKQQFQAYLRDVAAGKSDADMGSYFPGGLPQLEKELAAYLNRPISYRTFELKNPVVTEVSLRPMTEAENALTRQEMLFLIPKPTEALPKLLKGLRATAARFPQSAYAQTLLADAERKAGNMAEANAAADRAIGADPTYARGLSSKAELLLARAEETGTEADWDAAGRMIVRANRADTEDPVPLEQFYRFATRRGTEVPRVAYDGLWKAFAMVPQNPRLRMMAATALANRKEYGAAMRLLDPLANAPHNSSMRQSAIALRQAIAEAGQTGGPISLETPEE